MNFTSQLNRGNFYLSSQSFQIWWLYGSHKKIQKFQLNISKIMPARPKEHKA